MKTFVIGDIHGAHKALLQCFERSGFDYQNDRLIALGDVCDGWPEVKECIDELLKVRHLIYILGNHDQWALDWGRDGRRERIWLKQGGENTIRSYGGQMMTDTHVRFLSEAKLYHQEDQRLFVHAGFDPLLPLDAQDSDTFVWDRQLIMQAFQRRNQGSEDGFGPFKEIYLGHTPTLNFYIDKPMQLCNVWAVDTGAGWDGGRLTIMDIATKQFWQSEQSQFLYPGESGRSAS